MSLMIELCTNFWHYDDDSYDRFAIVGFDNSQTNEVIPLKSVDDVLYAYYSEAEDAAYAYIIDVYTKAKEQGKPLIQTQMEVADVSIRRAKRVDSYA
jgi:hypothetical protein